MGCYNRNKFHGNGFPCGIFWLHVAGALLIFFLGMRFGFRRAPFPKLVYRLTRMLVHR